jgi:stage III sporulation protein AH
MIIRTTKRTRLLIFVVLVAAALALVVAQWSGPPTASRAAAPAPVPSGTRSAATPTVTPGTRAAPASTPAGYFVTARLEQQQAESRELALDQQVAADTAASAAVRSDAEARMLALGRRQDQEAEIRALLLAKGYQDAVVYLGEQPASAVVVVQVPALTEADVARVADAVQRVAGVPAGDISVMAHR